MGDGPRKISRRSFLGRVVGGAVAGTLAVVASAAPVAKSGSVRGTDADPDDPVGRGIYDSDPIDPVGRGGPRRRRRRSGVTDRDPTDPVNNGRGRISRRRRCTDSDPRDPAGRSRYCRRR